LIHWDECGSEASSVENPADLLKCLSGTDNVMPEPQKLERMMWGGVLTDVGSTHTAKMTMRRSPQKVETNWQRGRWDTRLQFLLGDLSDVHTWTVESVENLIETGHYEGLGHKRNVTVQENNPGVGEAGYMTKMFAEPETPEQERLPPPPRKAHDPHPCDEADRVANAYLDQALNRKVTPGVPRSLQLSDGSAKELDLRDLDLTDDGFACISAGLKHRAGDFTGINLAGNPRLTSLSHMALFQLLNERCLNHDDHVLMLDLSGANFKEEALRILGESFHSKLAQLHSLKLRGVNVPSSSWPSLAEALRRLPKLEELVLADTQIGRETQRSALAAVDAFIGLPCLKNLDVSCNFFGLEGCRALAEYLAFNKALGALDLSFNAGGFVPAQENVTKKKKKGDSDILYNPLLLVCEGVAHARALEVLRLAQCQLGFDEDFVLEDACAEASIRHLNGLRELDLSGNPLQGPSGARCLMRLVVQMPDLNNLYVTERGWAGAGGAAASSAWSWPLAYCQAIKHRQRTGTDKGNHFSMNMLQETVKDLYLSH
jgi:Ran GTPase-activating protein (RanGAP) involved in mRNA processing and transport